MCSDNTPFHLAFMSQNIDVLLIIFPLIGIILLILVLKIAFATMVKTTGLNQYDLVIFKALESKSKNSILIGRKMFDNNAIRQHNLKAALDTGFDLNKRKTSNGKHNTILIK